MYQIFAPLDTEERLPREILLDGRRHRWLGKRHIAGFLWGPALLATLALVIWAGGNPPAAFAAFAVLFGLFWLITCRTDRAT